MHSRRTDPGRQDDYLVPHWINLSFYTSDRKIGYSTFTPRIKLPPLKNPETADVKKRDVPYFPPRIQDLHPPDSSKSSFSSLSSVEFHLSGFAYDEYDAQVFELPRAKGRTSTLTRKSLTGSSSNISSPKKEEGSVKIPSKDDSSVSEYQSRSVSPRKSSRAIKIPSQHLAPGHLDMYSRTYSGQAPHHDNHPDTLKYDAGDSDCEETYDQVSSSLTEKPVWGSAGHNTDIKKYMMRPGRALVNPFDPSNVTVKLTSNRRRWTHIFPKAPTPNRHGSESSGGHDTSTQAHSPSSSYTGTIGRNTSIDATLRKISDWSAVSDHVHDTSMGAHDSTVSSGVKMRSVSVTGGDHVSRLGSVMWGVSTDMSWDATLTTGDND